MVEVLDKREWDVAFDALAGPLKESLARRMLVAGGQILRDEARLRAPRSEAPYNPSSRGSHISGTLAENIYLAFSRRDSTENLFTYKISWNDANAWWGRLLEFGHWKPFGYALNKQGQWFSINPSHRKGHKGEGKWIPAEPFLGPSYDSHLSLAYKAMIETGRAQFPVLVQEMLHV